MATPHFVVLDHLIEVVRHIDAATEGMRQAAEQVQGVGAPELFLDNMARIEDSLISLAGEAEKLSVKWSEFMNHVQTKMQPGGTG